MATISTSISQALKHLLDGGVIGLPTETVYGLAADASHEIAVRKIFAVKGRPSNHPLIVHVASLEKATEWSSDFSQTARALGEKFWPGPLTIIVPSSAKASDIVTGGQPTVGLRVPKHPLTLELLTKFKGGLAAPSANRFGKISPTTAQHVRDDLGNDIEFILDGGQSKIGLESTIVDVSRPDAISILRPGAITPSQIESVVGQKVKLVTRAAESTTRAPGLLAAHYAPRAGVKLVDETEIQATVADFFSQNKKIGLWHEVNAFGEAVVFSRRTRDAAIDAQHLYEKLRWFDLQGVDVIVTTRVENSGIGLAVNDRLQRAAASSVTTR